MAVTYAQIGEIKPAKRNARTHSPAQIAQIARSIDAFGWTNPILVDEHNVIIAGHGRLEAAKLQRLAEVPTITLAGLSDDQKRALVIADNALALNAGWDEETLRQELGELGAAGFDVSLVGFSQDELDALLGDPLDGAVGIGNGAGSLAAQFGIPPFSVLNAREGWWQDRKRAWLALGIQSEIGRGGDAGHGAAVPGEGGATAIYRKRPGFKYAVPGGGLMPLERGYAS